jgi:hypothetical protein
MKEFTAIIRDMYGKEHEEVHRVPDLLNPEETIKTSIRMFNMQKGAKSTFVKLKRARTK